MANWLFILDNDYGGLGVAMYLLRGQALAKSTVLLLPSASHEFQAASLGVASRPYRGLEDILQAVEAERPDGVVLFSGYLFPSQGVLKAREVGVLVDALRARGCVVATNDPYMGTFRRIAEADLGWLRRMQLAFHARRLTRILASVAHIDPSPMDADPAGPRRYSFFNPEFFRYEPPASAATPSWLFVLASFDLDLQERLHGRDGFADRVAARMLETLAGGREPTFIGPARMVAALGRRLGADARVTLFTRCPYDEFERRLLGAEAAFYWQLFPTSAFLRLWGGLPAFFFDRGHNARLLSPMYEAGIKHLYLGTSPALLDIERPLDVPALLAMKAGFARSAERFRERLGLLPAPGEMMAAILRGD